MPIKTLLTIVFVLAVALATRANAATTPFWGDISQRSSQEQPVETPDATRLQANWWRYFQVKDAELDNRIIATSQRLSALLAGLPQETERAVRPLVERVENTMDALAETKAESVPALPKLPPPFAEEYSTPQLFDIVQRLHDEQQALRAQRVDVAASEKAIRNAIKGIDTSLAAYLRLAPDNPGRVLFGLEIMADRLSVGVAEEQLRISKARLIAQQAVVNQLLNEQAAAIERLKVKRDDLERLDAEIAQAQVILEQAQERLIKQQTTVFHMSADTPVEKATVPYRQQQVVNTAVVEAIARAGLIRLWVERQLAALLLDVKNIDTRAIREQLLQWNEQLSAIRREIVTWTSDSQRERDRADEALAATSAEEGGVEPLIRVVYRDRLALARETLAALQRLESLLIQAALLINLVDQELARQEGGLRNWLTRGELGLRQFLGMTVEWASQSLFKIGDTPVTTFGLLRVVLILFIAWLVSYWFRRALQRLGERREDVIQSALYTVGRLTHYTLITLGFIIGLSSIGIDFTNLMVMAGAIGIGIGFGLQSIVRNFVSGIILLFERTLKVGDFVELASGVAGEVRAINVRSTVINTNDNVDIVVPNSQFIDHDVINWTLLENYRRIHVPFRVAYGTDTGRLKQVVLEAADKVPHTLKARQPTVWLVDFGENSLEFELVVWITPVAVKKPGAVNAAYKWEIEAALRKHNIPIPLPQRDLHLRSGFKELFEADTRIPLDKVSGGH